MGVFGLALTSFSQWGLENHAAWRAPSEADKIFPWFIADQLPVGVRGLVVAGLLSAAMSSIDSGINSISAVVTFDFYQRFFGKGEGHPQHPRCDDGSYLRRRSESKIEYNQR